MANAAAQAIGRQHNRPNIASLQPHGPDDGGRSTFGATAPARRSPKRKLLGSANASVQNPPATTSCLAFQ
eukprot:9275393-Lingulodinium_polyedra.AAC.1